MNLILLAQTTPAVNPPDAAPPQVPLEIWLIIGVGLLIAVSVIVWAYRKRRKEDKVSGWGPSRSQYRPAESKESTNGQGSHRRRRKWRRRRRDHRPRNPTLAETGGLPPVRQNNALDEPE